MINKIISIKNIGRFHNYSAKGNVEWGKVTLFYGENGRGKTTISSILQSMQRNDPYFIEERKTLGSKGNCECSILIDKKPIFFKENTWQGNTNNLSIYDKYFIAENVYIGNSIEADQKRHLYKLILGLKGVKLAEEIEVINSRIKEITGTIRLKEANVKKYLPDGLTIEKFIELKIVPDIDLKIEQVKKEIEAKNKLINEANSIKKHEKLKKVSILNYSDSFLQTIAKQLKDIELNAADKITKHVSDCMKIGNNKWLEDGLSLIKNEKCPFCGHSLSENTIIDTYRSFFNNEYSTLKSDVFALKKKIEAMISSTLLFSIQKTISENETNFNYWAEYFKFERPILSFENIKKLYSDLHSICNVLIEKKESNILESVLPDEEYNFQTSQLALMEKDVQEYNTSVDKINTSIDEYISKLPIESDINLLNNKLSEYENIKKRYSKKAIESINKYLEWIDKKEKESNQKTKKKEELDDYCNTLPEKYEEIINKYLERFGVGFRVSQTSYNYKGGVANTQYQLDIENCCIGLDKFDSVMSAGDRSSLALAFFCASLEMDQDMVNKGVIFDDPFTSLDLFRREATSDVIKELSQRVSQLAVFSHDMHFLKNIYDKIKLQSNVKTYIVSIFSKSSVINEWDVNKAVQSFILKNYSILCEYLYNNEGNPVSVARSIRPLLEGWLKGHFIGHFSETDWLGDCISKIRCADDSSTLSHAKDDLPEIEAINDYSKKFHHDQAQDYAISEEELKSFIKRTLMLICAAY